MRFVLWIEVPDGLAQNAEFQKVLDAKAQAEAAAVGKTIVGKNVERGETLGHTLIAWDLS